MKKRILCVSICALVGMTMFAACGKGGNSTQESAIDTQESLTETTEATETTAVTETTELIGESVPDDTAVVADSQEENSQSQSGETEADTNQQAEEPVYTYEEMSATMYAKSSVNIRELPCVDGEQLGKLNKFDIANVTGKCQETGWYRINYNNGTAYVSGEYLITEAEKKAIEEEERKAAEKKAQEEAQKQEQTNHDNEIKDNEKDVNSSESDEKRPSDEKKPSDEKQPSNEKQPTDEKQPSNENQNKKPEWLMMESASKVLTADQKAHIDGMVKKWMNDSSYSNGQLKEDIYYYLESLGYVIGEDVTRTAMDRNAGTVWSAEQLADLPWRKQNVYDVASVYEFEAYYTEWKYDGVDRLVVYKTYVTVMK